MSSEFLIEQIELQEADDFFNSNPEPVLAQVASEMNQAHPDIPSLMQDMESQDIPGDQVDEIHLIVMTVWYIYTKIKKKKIKMISQKEIEKNLKLYISFTEYFNNAYRSNKGEDLDKIKYLQDINLALYLTTRLNNYFEGTANIPKEVSVVLLTIIKTLEDNVR